MKDLDYLWLFIVITAGVACGSLISNWVTARVAAYELEQVAAQMQQSVKKQTDRLNAQSEAIHQQSRTQRIASQQGKTLERECREWENAARQTPTHTTQTEAKKRCDRYQRYVDTGSSAR